MTYADSNWDSKKNRSLKTALIAIPISDYSNIDNFIKFKLCNLLMLLARTALGNKRGLIESWRNLSWTFMKT